MKKILFIVIAVTTAFVACKKDDENGDAGTGIIDYIEKQEFSGGDSIHHNYVISFSYDASSRIAEISETHYIIDKGGKQEPHGKEVMVVTYKGNTASTERSSYYPKEGDWELNYTYNDNFTLDSDGKISQFSQEGKYTSNYEYDNGCLIKINGYDAYSGMNIEWSNGDLVKAGDSDLTYSSKAHPFADTIDITVHALNDWYPAPLYFYAAGLFGKHSAHLVESSGDTNYTYEKDSKGRISKMIHSYTYEGKSHKTLQYVIHYK